MTRSVECTKLAVSHDWQRGQDRLELDDVIELEYRLCVHDVFMYRCIDWGSLGNIIGGD